MKKSIQEYNELNSWAEKIKNSADEQTLKNRPDEKTWSPLECIDHLNTTYGQYIPAIHERLTHPVKGNRDNYKPSYFGRKFTEMMEPPYKSKMKTFKKFVPKKELEVEDTFTNFVNYNNEMIEIISKLEGIDIKKTKVTSPALSIIKFQIGELFPFLAAHSRRHLWQAEQIIERIKLKN